MRMTAIALPLLLLLAPSCTDLGDPADTEDDDDDEPDIPGTPTEPDPLGPDFDFTSASWHLSNISKSEGTISHDGQLAFIDRFAVAVFSEPKADDFGDQDIFKANQTGNDWAPETLTLTSTTQLAFPAIAASGDALWYSWTGRADADTDLDIWLWRSALGGIESEHMNLTRGQPGEPRQNYESRVLPDGNGGVDVLYLSRIGSQTPTDHDVRTVSVSATGQVGTPTPIHAGYCYSLRSAVDGFGIAHAVAICTGGESSLVHFEKTKAGWQSEPVPMGESRGATAPDIAVDADGVAHIIWSGTTDCAGETCRRVFYSRGLAEPVRVADEPGFMPVLDVDPYGRAVVAFHRTGDEPAMMITQSDASGTTFATPTPLALSGDRDTSATQLTFDKHGRPHLVFDRIYTGSSPLNSEVMHATID